MISFDYELFKLNYTKWKIATTISYKHFVWIEKQIWMNSNTTPVRYNQRFVHRTSCMKEHDPGLYIAIRVDLMQQSANCCEEIENFHTQTERSITLFSCFNVLLLTCCGLDI